MAKHDVVVSQGKRTLKKRMLARWQLYLLLLIPVAYILIFAYGPMAGLIIAFKKYNVRLGIFDSPWVGFDNFRKFFSSYKFPIIMKNTIVISLYSLVVTFPIPIIFALLLNCMNGRIYKKMIQTVTYIPYFISSVVMVGLIFQILDNRSGIYGAVYKMLTGTIGPNIFADGSLFKHIYVWSAVWQTTGYSAIIYIAALTNVDQSLHEAALIDGAKKGTVFFKITFPMISSVAFFNIIMQLIQALQNFTSAFVVTNGGPSKATYVLGMKLYTDAFRNFNMGYACATSWIMFAMMLVMTLVLFATSKKWVYYDN